MCRTYKIAFYTVLINAVDGEILLVPGRVHLLKMLELCFLHYDILLCVE